MIHGADLVRHAQELFRELAQLASLSELYRQSVAGLLNPLGFDRAALFLYDETTREMRGTWGTDDTGAVVDESSYHAIVPREPATLAEALANPNYIKVWQDRELTLWDKPVGRGWNAMVVLQDGDRSLGWLSIDNAFHQRPLDPLEQEVLALFGRTLSALIVRRQFADLSEKYRSQNALKDRLFTILAHDLRGPIGTLSVMLGMACDQPMDPSDLKEVLQESRQASLRTYGLLDNVLGWVRGQIEEVAVLRERITVVRPLIAVQNWLEATAKAKGIRLKVECPEAVSAVTDERMLETIVRNLVSNAVKYSPPGATVLLRGRAVDGSIVVEVVDTGLGISADKLEALFAPAQKRSEAGTAGESGSGLGLMFSCDLARNLGGRLEADSRVGKGSTFRLVLPDELDGEL